MTTAVPGPSPWWPGWLGRLYLAVCTALAASVCFGSDVGPLPFWILVLLTLPLSAAVFLVQYVGFPLVFGIEDWWLPRTLGFGLWVGAVVAQVLVVRWLLRSARTAGPTSSAGSTSSSRPG